ncbi:MAG: hypothetical protein AB3N63_08150 [Puniceicoccaceae bacterium]
MKKLLLAFCSLALLVPLSYAQTGDGDGSGTQQQIRGDFSKVELPPELEAIKDQLEEARAPLMEARRALVDALKEDGATDEEIRAALKTWHEENAEAIAIVRGLAEQIQAYIRENRPERERPRITDRMRARMVALRENQQAMRQLRVQLRNEELTDEERAELKEQMGQLLRERKRLMRNRRADEGGNGGDDGRRPGD